MTPRAVFRADASLALGSGHIARCLTLAAELVSHGWRCSFVCRNHMGNMIDQIKQQGHEVVTIAVTTRHANSDERAVDWLGGTWQEDAQATLGALAGEQADWIVVDHYALDSRWERAVSPAAKRLLAIDDLADRSHAAHVLLDQNLGRLREHYVSLVDDHCNILAGTGFALLRPEFAAARDNSLRRRAQAPARRILVSMGGVDQANATSIVLETLAKCPLPEDSAITVIMGACAPWAEAVRAIAKRMPVPTKVLTAVDDMARHVTDSDLAIGAAGGSAWERASLGLPTLLVVLADNQRAGAAAMSKWGAGRVVGDVADIAIELPKAIAAFADVNVLHAMSAAAAALVDGCGVQRVVAAMEACRD